MSEEKDGAAEVTCLSVEIPPDKEGEFFRACLASGLRRCVCRK